MNVFLTFLRKINSITDLKNSQLKRRHSIRLTTVDNARELGGYPTQDGRTVKKGVLLRTAALTKISDADIRRLKEIYHLDSVIDLRTSYEIAAEPEHIFPDVKQYNLKILDEKRIGNRGFANVYTDKAPNPDVVQKLNAVLDAGLISDQMYVKFLKSEFGKAGYREFFHILLNNPNGKSVLWHCTCGKDRTGVAAMLILGVLNVDHQTIMDDFLLTNVFFQKEIRAMRRTLKEKIQDEERVEKMLAIGTGVYGPYMQNALDYITNNFGDISSYAKAELGLTEEDIATLRNRYTESL